MTPVPLDLPLRPSEAALVAGLIFESAEKKPLTDDLRSRIAARAAALHLETLVPYFGSLERDPVHHSTYYLAVDVLGGHPQLLHMAPATAPTSSIFEKPLLVGRMRRSPGPEIVINTIPFGAADSAALEKFSTRINTAFLPRPNGSRATLVVPAAAGIFDAFRAIFKRTGRNVCAIGPAPGQNPDNAYYSGMWDAIRAGWRDGYTAVARLSDPESAQEAARFSTFAFDASLFSAGSRPSTVAEEWILDQFSGATGPAETAYTFTSQEALEFAAIWGEALLAAERAFILFRQTRSALRINRPFDLELALDSAAKPVTPRELVFCLHWLKARGHAVQLVAPNLDGADEDRIAALVAVARHYQCAVHLAPRFAGVLPLVARSAAGRLTYSFNDAGADAVRNAADVLLG